VTGRFGSPKDSRFSVRAWHHHPNVCAEPHTKYYGSGALEYAPLCADYYDGNANGQSIPDIHRTKNIDIEQGHAGELCRRLK
jgi:hypothetical protein